jgi:hypothetical protein
VLARGGPSGLIGFKEGTDIPASARHTTDEARKRITNLRGGVFSLSSNAELTHIYSSQSHYTDIATGNCRTHRAMTNWDFCTGVGVPKGP